MITREEAVAYLLGGRSCESCGASLPGPGEPCGSCGCLPSVTSAELGEQLTGPMALSAVEAAKIRTEGQAALVAAIGRMADADRVVYMARLQACRDEAQQALDAHCAAQKPLEAPVLAAREAEAQASRELAGAREEHAAVAQAEETARRMRRGLTAETEAAQKLTAATAVLQRYETAYARAGLVLRDAEGALAASRARTRLLEQARDLAAAAVASPPRIPVGIETICAGLMRLVLGGQLDEVEMLMAGLVARSLCTITGAADGITATARQQLLTEQEEAARGKPLHLRNGRDGVAATPNPLAQGTPQPYHPAQHPAHPVTPAPVPGW